MIVLGIIGLMAVVGAVGTAVVLFTYGYRKVPTRTELLVD